jgi:hypothetical protein
VTQPRKSDSGPTLEALYAQSVADWREMSEKMLEVEQEILAQLRQQTDALRLLCQKLAGGVPYPR